MKSGVKKIWTSRTTQQLAEVLADIGDNSTMRNFLRDVMTEKEIIEISNRLEAASMLKQGITYVEVSKKTNLSSRTVARISDWMQNGCNGYQTALQIMNIHGGHIPPASAD